MEGGIHKSITYTTKMTFGKGLIFVILGSKTSIGLGTF